MKIVDKLKQKKGETLTETLGALLIIVPGMVMLAGAIVTASRINAQTKDADVTKLPSYSESATFQRTENLILNIQDEPQTIITLGQESTGGSSYYYYRP